MFRALCRSLELGRSDPLGVGLFAMLLNIHPQVLGLDGHTEWDAETPHDCGNHQGAKSCQSQ